MYENFYHLKAKPFRLSPDPSFFYASRGHKRALAYLRYGLSQDEGFVVITGAPGTGKTTLAQILMQEMDQSELVVAQLTTSQLDAQELLRMVAASFGLRYDGVDKAGLLKTMEAFLLARAREHKRALLVVDEAQNLPPESLEELRMLSNLMVGGKALLQTFLLGQAQFRNMLDNPDLEQLCQRVIANYHLSELAEDECQSYIETRLQHVGWKGDPKITTAAYEGIYQYTQGVPRRINMLCDRLMLFGCLEERHEIDESVLSDVTDELQQEISGKPIKKNKLAKAKNDPEINQDEEKSLETYFNTDFPDDESTVEELENKDQHSAYANIKDSKSNEPAPDENDDELVAQVDEVLKIEVSGASPQSAEQNNIQQDNNQRDNERNTPRNTQRNNKDRFQVISGGRDGKQEADTASTSTPGSTSKSSVRPANNPVPRKTPTTPQMPGDTEEVILRKILRLVLAYHRSPRSFPGLDDSTQLLPNGIKQILTLAISDDETLKNLRQISVMGISPSMLRAAVRFFVRRVLFIPGGDDHRVLGLSSDATRAQVEEHYGLLMRLMRQEKKGSDETGVTRIGESYERLCLSEITHIPDESPGIEENDEIDEQDDLDLDLAPDIRGYDGKRKKVGIGSNVMPDVIAGDHRTGPVGRNVVLVAGVLVVVFTLYLTQIRSTVEPNVRSNAAIPVETQEPVNSDQQLALVRDLTDNASSLGTGVEQSGSEKEEYDRQLMLEELRAESDARERERRVADALARARLEDEIRKATRALETAEAEVRQESQARARAEAAAQAALQAKAVAEAKTNAALKEKQLAVIAKQNEAKARAKAEKEKQLALLAKQNEARARVKAEKEKQLALLAKQNEVKARAKAEKKIQLALLAKQNEARARAKAEIAAKMAKADKKTTVIVKPQAKPVVNKTLRLKAFVTALESAYKDGDLEGISTLFAAKARTNDQTNLTGIRSDYRSLFNNTTSRKLTLSNLDWKLDNNYARAIGKYGVVTLDKETSQKTELTGAVTIQLDGLKEGRLQITRLYFTETKTSKKTKQNPVTRPSLEELNKTLESFASTYKKGNIEQFMALFSPDAKTNDRSTLEGIRGDYVDLFTNTSIRRLDYTDMQWQWEGDIANGVGAYVVTVQPKGKDTSDIYRGKLRFSVKRYGNKLLISSFVFE